MDGSRAGTDAVLPITAVGRQRLSKSLLPPWASAAIVAIMREAFVFPSG